MTLFHHKLLTREGRVLADGWTHPSSMTVFVHVFIKNVIQKVSVVTLHIIFRVSPWSGIKDSNKNKVSLVTSVHILINFSLVAGYLHR